MKLLAHQAMNKLLKGETLFHENSGKVFPVIMKNGKLSCVESQTEWSFSDFTQFNDKKEDFVSYDFFVKHLKSSKNKKFLKAERNLNTKDLKKLVFKLEKKDQKYRILRS